MLSFSLRLRLSPFHNNKVSIQLSIQSYCFNNQLSSGSQLKYRSSIQSILMGFLLLLSGIEGIPLPKGRTSAAVTSRKKDEQSIPSTGPYRSRGRGEIDRRPILQQLVARP
ncbi:hypothetical protein V6N13_034999 [Hibiscus sabdariffa]